MEKTEKTAKIHILGAAGVLVSAVKLEDWKRVEKYAPEVLTVTNEEGEPVFRVMTATGTGSMNHYGITWGVYTSEEGYATVTVIFDDEIENKKEAITDILGSGFRELVRMEQKIPELLEEIRQKEQEIESCITQA